MPSAAHTPSPYKQPMQWDIFCRVVDNFGDIGICWRLSQQMAAAGHSVRLWVDDASALRWMAPGALEGHVVGVSVLDWALSADAPTLATLTPADVWIEAFGCEIAPEFVATYAASMGANGQNSPHKPPVWINLEYLSAEPYAERCHGLPSPVMHGPAKAWTKHFFYPGFTDRTGGLLREPDLDRRQSGFDRSTWLGRHGIQWTGERLVSLFCYEPPLLEAFLDTLAHADTPTQLLVTHGRATQAVRHLEEKWLQRSLVKRGQLSISYLPPLTQNDYDHLLWACDFNCVRGEDSIVRALWAGKPFVWNIYPQDDNAHHDKLNAFLDMLDASPSWRQFHSAWNAMPHAANPLITLLKDWPQWALQAEAARQRLCAQDDLASQLIGFVQKNR
nr:elongation factor P maturation arginine rhamnosyltransferase EarP [Rhodoferax aquaticus]